MSLYNALYNMLFAGIIGLVLGRGWFTIGAPGDPAYFLTRAWEMPHGWGWFIFLIIGITSACGSYLSTQAYRTAPASIVTPFEYTALLWATLWGILVWGDMPDRITLAGMCLVVGSGLYIVIRETILKRLQAKGKIVGTG
jgi:drug/metabolite transporter (DMT)-like permease